jgi:hypothetical protein
LHHNQIDQHWQGCRGMSQVYSCNVKLLNKSQAFPYEMTMEATLKN